jgi:hypothetical protein
MPMLPSLFDVPGFSDPYKRFFGGPKNGFSKARCLGNRVLSEGSGRHLVFEVPLDKKG